jgi:hypothetical protein
MVSTKRISEVSLTSFRYFALFALSLFIGSVFAQGAPETGQRIIEGLNALCIQLVTILPVLAILLFVLAAVVYGVGHVFGAEMRSKATSWATSMVVGAVISLLIFLLAKPILSIFVPDIQTSDFCQTSSTPY